MIVLCVVGACITAAPTGESGADAATGQTSPSGGQSGSGESSENGTSSAEVSREPYIPPDPSVYPTVTDADIGPDEIDSFFDDSVFVGHSVMMHFKDKYVAYKRGSDSGFLGGAKFHASGSFSYHNNLAPVSADSVHPLYQGEKMKIEDAVAAMGAKTVYLSGMALNELALFGAEASVSNLAAVADAVKAKSPDARIVVLCQHIPYPGLQRLPKQAQQRRHQRIQQPAAGLLQRKRLRLRRRGHPADGERLSGGQILQRQRQKQQQLSGLPSDDGRLRDLDGRPARLRAGQTGRRLRQPRLDAAIRAGMIPRTAGKDTYRK